MDFAELIELDKKENPEKYEEPPLCPTDISPSGENSNNASLRGGGQRGNSEKKKNSFNE